MEQDKKWGSRRGNGSVSRDEYLRNKYGGLTKEELDHKINLRQAVHDELDRLKASDFYPEVLKYGKNSH